MLAINPIIISIGPFDIRWYAVCIILGMALVYLLSYKRLKAILPETEDIDTLFMITIFSGILGARLWSVAFNIEQYIDNPISVLYFTEGGLAIQGGVILGLIAAYTFLKRKNVAFLQVADILMPLVLIAQAMGRWGNFFNQEAYGSVVSVDVLNRFLPSFIVDQMYINGQYYHPTFLYESILNVIGFFVITIIVKKIKFKQGTAFSLYFIWYGITRYFIEALRTDSLYVANTSITLVIILLAIAFTILIGMLILVQTGKKPNLKHYLFIPFIGMLILALMIYFILTPQLEIRMAQFTSILFIVFGSCVFYLVNKRSLKHD